MTSEYEARLYEAVRSLFPRSVNPFRQASEQTVKMRPTIGGAIQLDSARLALAEDLRALFSGGGVEPSASSQFNDRRF